jgi:hypothetical protein
MSAVSRGSSDSFRTLNGIKFYFSRRPHQMMATGLIIWAFMMFLAIFVVYRRGFFLGLDHPENSFLPHPSARFGDFNLTFNEWRQLGFGTVGYGMSYFPAMYIPVHLLFRLFGDESESALIFVRCATLLATSSLILWSLRRVGFFGSIIALVLVLLSYPYLLVLQTGNLESVVVVLLVAAGILSRNRAWHLFGATIGLAAAMKGAPAIFFALPFFYVDVRTGLKSLVSGASTAVVVSLTPLLLWSEGFRYGGLEGITGAVRAIRASQAMYTELMVNSAAGIHYGHSLLNAIHAVFGMEFMASQTFGVPVFVVVTTLGLFSMDRARRRGNSLGVHLAVLGATSCLAPATSTDYKLLALVPALLVLADRNPELTKGERLIFCLISLAMAPKPYFRVGFDPWGYATVYGTALLLLGILLFPLISDIHKKRFGPVYSIRWWNRG